jgi:DNA adenine methylase
VSNPLKAPFPWFGGKSRVADIVWSRLGTDCARYVEPFFGSGAVLLARPLNQDGLPTGDELINDLDGLLANFWRALRADPAQVAHWAADPMSEIDLSARHGWLINRKARMCWLLEDPDYYDPKAAGWWLWGIGQSIAGGWCSGEGPWVHNGVQFNHVETLRKVRVKAEGLDEQDQNVLGWPGISWRMPGVAHKSGIHGGGVAAAGLFETLERLSIRLRPVMILSGDWKRVTTPATMYASGCPIGVFLDPPYAMAERAGGLYGTETECSAEVRTWAIEAGQDPKMRICLAGYEGEHVLPPNWECVAWKAQGGYGNRSNGRGKANAGRERLWFSPGCLRPSERLL